ncbi:MAG: hypothetical protein HQL23_01905 [Candidatus Omnitrophica bacterium]|nr:hypothetical protein [Candidatus Omnitrophota bacterium]
MDMQEIRSLINSTIYDLDTVDYLLDYGRIDETVTIVNKILNRIQYFRDQTGKGPYDLKDIFQDDFWIAKINEASTFGDMRNNVRQASRQVIDISEKVLNQEEYINFVKKVASWVYENVRNLRRKVRTPLKKKIERVSVFLAASLAVGGLIVFCIMQIFARNWGLHADFYEGRNFDRYVSSEVRHAIDISEPYDFDGKVGPDDFSARYTGFLKAPKDGKYLFTIIVDDGARLFIDGVPIIDEWRRQGDRIPFSKNIYLPKGLHSIRLDYFQSIGPAVLKLFWTPEHGQQKIIPADFLRQNNE